MGVIYASIVAGKIPSKFEEHLVWRKDNALPHFASIFWICPDSNITRVQLLHFDRWTTTKRDCYLDYPDTACYLNYPDTACRKAGFPRGHFLHPTGKLQYPPNQSNKRTINMVDGDGKDGCTNAARRLLLDVFRAPESGGPLSHCGPGAQGVLGGMGSFHEVGKTKKGGGVVSERGCRLPKRLLKALPLFAEMISRAHRCNFGRLLEAYCPLPEEFRLSKARRTAGGKCHFSDRVGWNVRLNTTVPHDRGVSMAQDGAVNGSACLATGSRPNEAKRARYENNGPESVDATWVKCSQPRDNQVFSAGGKSGDWAPTERAAEWLSLADDHASKERIGRLSEEVVGAALRRLSASVIALGCFHPSRA